MRHDSRTTPFLILSLVLLSLAGCQGEAAPSPEPTSSTGEGPLFDTVQAGSTTALGTIQPAQQLKLSFLASGPVSAVYVQVGSEVKAGDSIAVLDRTELALAVQEAEDGLALAQARLEQAQAGPREEQVAAAEADYQQVLALYEQALARQEQTLTGTHPEAVAIAEADHQAALARLEQVSAGASPEELAQARVQVQKAEVGLQRAQAAYDRVAGQPDVGASPEAAALQEASLDHALAKAQYERLRRLPSQAELREAQAEVSRAEAQLRLAQAGPSEEALVASANNIPVAEAQLALAQAGPRTQDVAVAAAQVQQARTALEWANLALARSELVAPFDGTVSAVYLHAGEWAAAGAPVVEFLDTTGWLVETRNVGELNVGHVKVGQEAIVQVMAFRGEALRGRVIAISPVAVVQQGDTTYTVMIELEPTDLNLRPGMNAEVALVTE